MSHSINVGVLMFPIVCSKLQPQRPYLLQWITLQISISRLFLVAPSTYILAEIHTILTDMLLHGLHLSSATLHVINLQLYGYRKLYLNLHLKLYLKLYLKLFRKLYLKQFPLSTVAIQAPVVPQWRQRLDDVTILYSVQYSD